MTVEPRVDAYSGKAAKVATTAERVAGASSANWTYEAC